MRCQCVLVSRCQRCSGNLAGVTHSLLNFYSGRIYKTENQKQQQVGVKFSNFRQLPSSRFYFLQVNVGKNTVYTTILKIQGELKEQEKEERKKEREGGREREREREREEVL